MAYYINWYKGQYLPVSYMVASKSSKLLLTVLLLLALIATHIHTIEIKVQQSQNGQQLLAQSMPSTDQDYTGSYFSKVQLQCIRGNISLAQNIYSANQMASIAAYVAQAMNKYNSVNKYSVYVYDNTTKHAAMFLDIDLGAHLWWIQYGKYNLTYVLDFRSACRNMGTSGAPSQFGEQVSKSDQDLLTEIVKNSALYRGDNVLDAASYIYQKISDKYGRYFKVYVGSPSSNWGFYECRTGEYWGYFKNFTDRKWSYYIVRSQKP